MKQSTHTTDPATVQKIAQAFISVLQSPSWFGCVISGDVVANANDQFDANMAMDQAFRKSGQDPLPEDEAMSEAATDLWNAAWAYAEKLADMQTGIVTKNGVRVRLKETVDCFPTGVFEKGLTGTIEQLNTSDTPFMAMVKLDKNFPELDEWENCLQCGVNREECLLTFDNLEVI